MKWLNLLVGASVMLTASAGAAAVDVEHFVTKGASARLSAYDGDRYGTIDVSRSGMPRAQTSFVYFDTSSCWNAGTSWGCTGMYGYGEIPNAQFVVQGQAKEATLATRLEDLEVIQYEYTCDDLVGLCTYEETYGAEGPLNATWTRNGMGRYTSQVHVVYESMPYRLMEQRHESFQTADATALIGDWTLPNPTGSIGTSHGGSITIEREVR